MICALGQDVGDVGLHGVARQEQLCGDVRIRIALRHKPGHLELGRSQRRPARRRAEPRHAAQRCDAEPPKSRGRPVQIPARPELRIRLGRGCQRVAGSRRITLRGQQFGRVLKRRGSRQRAARRGEISRRRVQPAGIIVDQAAAVPGERFFHGHGPARLYGRSRLGGGCLGRRRRELGVPGRQREPDQRGQQCVPAGHLGADVRFQAPRQHGRGSWRTGRRPVGRWPHARPVPPPRWPRSSLRRTGPGRPGKTRYWQVPSRAGRWPARRRRSRPAPARSATARPRYRGGA